MPGPAAGNLAAPAENTMQAALQPGAILDGIHRALPQLREVADLTRDRGDQALYSLLVHLAGNPSVLAPLLESLHKCGAIHE